MKYTTYVALIATVAAQPKNSTKIIDGAAFEAFQEDFLQAGADVKKFIKEDLKPNYK
jgi:hypothetical protein